MKAPFGAMQAKNNIAKIYRQKLDELPVRYELMQIETTYGDTNIVITGTENKHTLVLLHGTNPCAPLAFETLKELVNDFKIYAIDLPHQANLSAEIQLNFQDNSYGKWMFEILSRLGIQDALLVGIEFGGFVALKTLTFDERRIAKAFLIAPAGIIKPNKLRYFFKMLFSLKRFRKHREENQKTNILKIPAITENQASKIKTPLYIFADKNDVLYAADRLRKRAKKLFKSLKESFLLEGTTHRPANEHYKTITEIIRKNNLENSNN